MKSSEKLLTSKWHDNLKKEIDSILSRELEKISEALNVNNLTKNHEKLLWYHHDRLLAMQYINDGNYNSNCEQRKMSEQTVITLND